MSRRGGYAREQLRAVHSPHADVCEIGGAGVHAHEHLTISGSARHGGVEQRLAIHRHLKVGAFHPDAHLIPAPVFHLARSPLHHCGLRQTRLRIVHRPFQFETARSAQ